MAIRNINEKWGDPIVMESVEEFEELIQQCGYEVPEDGLVEGVDYEIVEQRTYEMTVSGNDIVGTWVSCKAKTLDGAMREATRLYGSGYTHHTIKVAIAETETQERQIVATREIAERRWERF